ncbi:MAG: hypothetical protein U0414_13730 [Polyangiaceae bacterium]
MASLRRPAAWSLVALFVFGCSSSSSSGSSGCGSSAAAVCKINTNAMLCPGRITIECFADATPDAKDQCTAAIKQSTEVIYCCTSNADAASGGGAP